MLPLFLCPDTIRAASCRVSSQLISSAPAPFGSGATAIYPPPPSLRRPLCRPPLITLRLHSPSQTTRRNHSREPPQGLHGRRCHAWQSTVPRQTARPRRSGHAGCLPPRQSSCHQVGHVFRPTGISTFAEGTAENMPGNCFSPTPWGGFCTAYSGSSITAFTDPVSAAPAETAYED